MSATSPAGSDVGTGLPARPPALETGLSVRCEDLHHGYPGSSAPALDGVDLTVKAGESLALLGPSGSGKSTLLAAIGGLLRLTSGRVFVGADDVTAMSQRELLVLRGQRIGTMLQNPAHNLLPYATAEENIGFAQRAVRHYRRAGLPAPRQLLHRLGLEELAGRPVGRLSGGEQQRIAVAVAMAAAPGLLLADEPTSQLDRASGDHVLALFDRISRDFGTTVLAVTHDAAVARTFGRVLTITAGRADDGGQHRQQYVHVDADGAVSLPSDVVDVLPPGTRLRVVRRPHGVELTRDAP